MRRERIVTNSFILINQKLYFKLFTMLQYINGFIKDSKINADIECQYLLCLQKAESS